MREHDLSYENLDRAFRLVRRGAELIAMHRNGWWYTARGETIDTGAFVAALEYATGTRARLTGKPAPPMFRAAFRGPGRRRGGARAAAAAPSDGSRWSATTRPRTSPAPTAPGCAGSSSSPGGPPRRRSPGLRGPAVPGAVAASLGDVVAALD